jgi:hypothetical protein
MSSEDVLNPNITLISTSELEAELKNLLEYFKSLKYENEEEHKKIIERVFAIETTLKWLNIAKSQGAWKSKTCRHVTNGICNAWNISDPNKLGIMDDAIYISTDGTKRVIVNKFYEICITCPLYESKKS